MGPSSDKCNGTHEYLDFFIEEMGQFLDKKNLQKLLYLYNNNLRIPQELINYEYLLKVIQ